MSQTSYYYTFMYIPVMCERLALGAGVLLNRVFFSGVVAAIVGLPLAILRARRDGRVPVFHTGGQGSIPCARIEVVYG